MTYDEYVNRTRDWEPVPPEAISMTPAAPYVVPSADPPLFSGRPKARQTCECAKCGRAAVVICGTCDEVKP